MIYLPIFAHYYLIYGLDAQSYSEPIVIHPWMPPLLLCALQWFKDIIGCFHMSCLKNGKVESCASPNEAVRRPMPVTSIGALGATAIVAAEKGGRKFRETRDLAAWLELVPAEHSIGESRHSSALGI